MYVIGMVRMQVKHACALIPLPFYTILEVYILCNQSIPQKVYKSIFLVGIKLVLNILFEVYL